MAVEALSGVDGSESRYTVQRRALSVETSILHCHLSQRTLDGKPSRSAG